MEYLADGFYFVYCSNLGEVLLEIPDRERRDSLPFPPRVLRYKQLSSDDIVGWCNEFGTVVLLQRLQGIDDFARALALYRGDGGEGYYNQQRDRAISVINTLFSASLKDVDVVFLVALVPEVIKEGEKERGAQIEWEWSRVDNRKPFRLQILIEACMIFQLCKLVDAECDALVRSGLRGVDWLVLREHASSLYSIEQPERFMFSNREMELMDLFYTKWGLTESVRALEDRLEGATSLFEFYDGTVRKRREGLMNILLAAIAVLSILQVRDDVESVVSPLKNRGFDKWLVFGAAAFLVAGVLFFLASGILHWVRRGSGVWARRRFRRFLSLSAPQAQAEAEDGRRLPQS